MFTEHVRALALPTVEVVAVSDINVEKGKQRVSRFASKSLDLENGKGSHSEIYQSFHNAILHGGSSYGDGVQGRMGLELANAMTYSSYKGCEVEFPLDRQGYADLLNDLIQQYSKR